jgi:Asp-tRNA(Asn)/Glu-tRNA(Gln) amidotransferase A subunit family amidase
LRVGYLRSEFEGPVAGANADEIAFRRATRANNEAALDVIRSLVSRVVPFDLPDVPIAAIDFIRYAETAAYFDAFTRSGELAAVEKGPEQSARPIEVRAAYVTPAVAFVQANRFRSRVMEQVATAMADIDLFVGSRQLLTNRTGHPVVCVPSGFHGRLPTALHLTGHVLGDATILRLAHAFQRATDHHLRHPQMK